MSDENSKVNKIEMVDGVSQSKKTDPFDFFEVERVSPNKEYFASLVRTEKTQPKVEAIEDPAHASLISEIADFQCRVENLQTGTQYEIAQQSKNMIVEMEGIKQKLCQPDLNIKTSAIPLLHNKLNHIDESLKIALSKAGVDYTPVKMGIAGEKPSLAPAIEKFFNLLTDGQMGMQKLYEGITREGFELSPTSMLVVQMKMSHIQQELELFTSLLNKALESTKAIMNTQV